MNGVLVVDKPYGITSHDVVQQARRCLKTRAVGHTGTLDPLATGVLVLAIGQGTKLVPYLQAVDKRYDVEIQLGIATDTLDAEGVIVEKKDVPSLSADTIDHVLSTFLGKKAQQVPKYSAVKVDGVALHKRARRGEVVVAPSKTVELLDANILSFEEGTKLSLSLHCGKGYYVRSLARDLCLALGTVGHVSQLRRTTCGTFTLAESIDHSLMMRENSADVIARVLSLPAACRDLRRMEIDDDDAVHARHGRPLKSACTEASSDPVALLHKGQLVAIARNEGGRLRVVRGFVHNDDNLAGERHG